MKKNFLKISSIIIFSIIFMGMINMNQPNFAYASESPFDSQRGTQIKNIFKALNENRCIQFSENGEDPAKDDNYIITFIEEPLSTTLGEKADEPGSDFRQRICYRHFFQYNLAVEKTHKTVNESELSRTSCESPEGNELRGFANEANHARYSCKPILVLLSRGGVTMLYNYIGMIYRWGVSMVGIIAVLVIVISGIQISLAGGEAEAVTSAKRRIVQSLAGIAVLILSSIILYTINPDFFIR